MIIKTVDVDYYHHKLSQQIDYIKWIVNKDVSIRTKIFLTEDSRINISKYLNKLLEDLKMVELTSDEDKCLQCGESITNIDKKISIGIEEDIQHFCNAYCVDQWLRTHCDLPD